METQRKATLKKLVLGLALFSAGVPAAYALNCPNLVPVCRPEFCGRFGIGLEGDYFRAVGTDAQYGYLYSLSQLNIADNSAFPLGTSYHTTTLETRPGWHWGYRVDLTYYLPCTSNDIQLIWQDYQHANSDSAYVGPYTAGTTGGTSIISNSNGFLADLDTLLLGGPFSGLANKVQNKYNAVDLVAGQHINVGSKVNLRPFAGLRYAYLRSDVDSLSTLNVVPGNRAAAQEVTLLSHARSKINGLGLRSGTDIKYGLGSGFSLTGTFGGSLLAASVRKQANLITNSSTRTGATTVSFVQPVSFNAPSRQHVLPELDARLAVNYSYNFGCDCRSTLGIDVGYQGTYYFNAHDRVVMTNSSSTKDFIHQTDFGLRGPFVRLSYAF